MLTFETSGYVVRYRNMDLAMDASEKRFSDEDRAAGFAKSMQERGFRVAVIREQYAQEYYH